VNFDNILVLEKVVEANTLRAMLGRCSPNKSILEVILQLSVNVHANIFNRSASSQNQRVIQVRSLSALLCIDSSEVKVLPDGLNKVFKVKAKLGGNDDVVVTLGKSLDILQR
jgi:hypothetical protein